MFERFTDRARRTVVLAQQEAKELASDCIASEHLLCGLLREDSGRASTVLAAAGVSYPTVRDAAAARASAAPGPQLPFTANAKRVLETALREALQQGSRYIDAEHLLLGMLRFENGATALLAGLGVDTEALRAEITPSAVGAEAPAEPAAGREGRENRKAGASMLAQFGKNLCAAARDGELDPVVGRDREIERVIQVLCRRTKANPVLVGAPGVGKTAIAEGLAQRIAAGQVPDLLADVELWSVDMGAMVAGTRYRGDFEERVRGVIKEASSPSIILFIDEIHSVLGVGAGEGGGMDAGNMLKPALARGELRILGATTDDEYRRFQKDKALERRMAPVEVVEPSEADTVEILRGLRDAYEDHHLLVASDAALEAAVRYTARYLNDRQLPDKAIDALDEAMARARMQGELGRAEITEQRRTVVALHQARRRGEVVDAHALADAEAMLVAAGAPGEIGVSEIAAVVSQMSGVPIELGEEESAKLLRLEELLHGQVIGQDDAVSAVSRALRRVRAGFGSARRVGGAFLFVGPTGVGKTELAKALSRVVMGREDALIQLDMSEYMEAHSVSRLIGSPPGYVGHGEGGQLTEAVRRRPWSVLLFDEIEKAHPDVHNILLQLLEEGRLTDSQGRKVDFSNTVVIMTSNLGTAQLAKPSLGFQGGSVELSAGLLHDAVKKALRPELLGRIDEVIAFHALTMDQVAEIAELMVAGVQARLAEHGVTLELTEAAMVQLAEAGYDPALGARPLRRCVQTMVEDRLANALLEGEIGHGKMVVLDAGEGELALNVLDAPVISDGLLQQ